MACSRQLMDFKRLLISFWVLEYGLNQLILSATKCLGMIISRDRWEGAQHKLSSDSRWRFFDVPG